MEGLLKLPGIPKLEKNMAIIMLILNFISGGFGTIVAAFLNEGGFDVMTLVMGIGQFLTIWIGIGWIWGVVWGIFMVMKADPGFAALE
eukprot:gene6399-10406_t